MSEAHESVRQMWRAYLSAIGETPESTSHPLSFWHFCDNEQDADECADLVLSGRKTATAPSLWGFHLRGEPEPAVGDLHVITTWAGAAVCVIRTTHVDIVPFSSVTEEHAAAEGEGDLSLAFWRRVHLDYYRRELAGSGYQVSEDMPVVCERFEVVHRSVAP